PKGFDLVEEALNKMALFVNDIVTWPRFNAIFLWWNRVTGVLLLNVLPNLLRPVGFVRKNIASRNFHA
ncbi:hypothetical protein HMPREF9470_05704, partial [[Clostridium] citroniae WAL-19142]